MRNRNSNFDVVEKFKVIRSIYDKLFISIAGSLWIFSTLWDIYKLQRYWLDYAIEFYSCFFIFYMIMYSINPRALPTKIYNSFRLITTIRGRGTLLVIISSLFLGDKHAFHKTCAIFMFMGGILYYICEILVPTTKDELDKIESIYNNKDTSNSKEENITNSYTSTNPMNTSNIQNQDKSTVILENNPNNIIPDDNEGKTQKSQNQSEEQNIKTMDNNGNENNKYNGPNTKVEEEIVKKTDNPYEIPEDF